MVMYILNLTVLLLKSFHQCKLDYSNINKLLKENICDNTNVDKFSINN